MRFLSLFFFHHKNCSICDISLRTDGGSMQMVEHQMIYSPERKKQQRSRNEYKKSPLLGYLVNIGNNLLTLLATDSPSSRL
jgi:hypothetical protein